MFIVKTLSCKQQPQYVCVSLKFQQPHQSISPSRWHLHIVLDTLHVSKPSKINWLIRFFSQSAYIEVSLFLVYGHFLYFGIVMWAIFHLFFLCHVVYVSKYAEKATFPFQMLRKYDQWKKPSQPNRISKTIAYPLREWEKKSVTYIPPHTHTCIHRATRE